MRLATDHKHRIVSEQWTTGNLWTTKKFRRTNIPRRGACWRKLYGRGTSSLPNSWKEENEMAWRRGGSVFGWDSVYMGIKMMAVGKAESDQTDLWDPQRLVERLRLCRAWRALGTSGQEHSRLEPVMPNNLQERPGEPPGNEVIHK